MAATRVAQLTRLVAPLLALLLAGSAALAADAPKALIGRVVSIVDGATIKVRLGDRTETVRYIGMNGPELHHPTKGEEPHGCEAAEANRKLRAQIRDLMASGILPRVHSDGSLVDEAGRSVPGERHVGPVDRWAACIVCEVPGPHVTYQS